MDLLSHHCLLTMQPKTTITFRHEDTSIRITRGHTVFTVTYRVNGEIHRINDPAFIIYFANGAVRVARWYIEGKLHRVGAPAIVYYNQTGDVTNQVWYENGSLIHSDES